MSFISCARRQPETVAPTHPDQRCSGRINSDQERRRTSGNTLIRTVRIVNILQPWTSALMPATSLNSALTTRGGRYLCPMAAFCRNAKRSITPRCQRPSLHATGVKISHRQPCCGATSSLEDIRLDSMKVQCAYSRLRSFLLPHVSALVSCSACPPSLSCRAIREHNVD